MGCYDEISMRIDYNNHLQTKATVKVLDPHIDNIRYLKKNDLKINPWSDTFELFADKYQGLSVKNISFVFNYYYNE